MTIGVRNIAQCLSCHDVIESKSRHDFVSCKCGAIFVDGGRDYLRAGGDLDKFRPLYDPIERKEAGVDESA